MPGVNWIPVKGCFDVHRTHLPLLPEAKAILDNDTIGRHASHEARNERVNALGLTLRPWQQTALDFIEPRRGVLLADEMRLGKGQVLDARVLTPSGWIRMGELRVGDRVVDPDGGFGIVEGIYPQGERDVYRVETCDGASTVCDLDHLWLLSTFNDRHRGSGGRVLELRDFKDNLRQRAAPGRRKGNRTFFLPLCSPPTFDSVELSVAPYVLGVLLGDGHLSRRGGPTVCKPDHEVRDRVQSLLPSSLEARIVSSPGRALTWRICPKQRGSSNPIVDYLKQAGLRGCRSPEKFIPSIYLAASVEDRLELLRGLMDTDGDVSLQRRGVVVSFNTTSPRLRNGVRELVESLGGFASIYVKEAPAYSYKGSKRVGRKSFRLHIRLPVNPFTLPRKASRWQLPTLARGIEAVTYVGRQPTQCIKVSTKRNLYVTDGYIVTHNTLTSLLAHDPDTGPLVVVAPLSVRGVWRRWFSRLWPDVAPHFVEGREMDVEALKAAPIIFLHPDVIARHRLSSVRPGTLIVDEAHLFSNWKSQRTEGLLFYTPSAYRTVVLTGTPLWNRSNGLWPLLAACAPGAWGSHFLYSQRYCTPTLTEYGWSYGEVSNADEWVARRNEIMIARGWRDVMPDLPPIERELVLVPLDPNELRELDLLAAQLRTKSRSLTVEDLGRYRQATGLYKVPFAVTDAKRVLDAGNRIVVWAWHKTVVQAIAKQLRDAGYPVVTVTGDDSEKKRDKVLDAWRASSQPTALVLTIAVGQVGIDLSAAPEEVFAEVDWTPAVVSQAEMRPFDPTRILRVRYLVLNHEIDLALVSAVKGKVEVGSSIGVSAAGSMFSLPTEDEKRSDIDLLRTFAASIR